MSADQSRDQPGAEVVPLRAVPADVTEPATAAPTYADVTAPGERRPILPVWLQSVDAAKNRAKVAGGWAWHAGRFHGIRLPVYLPVVAGCAVLGIGRLVFRWLRWWLFPVPLEVFRDSVEDGHRAWHRSHQVHKETAKFRGLVSLAVIAGAWVAGFAAWKTAPHWLLILAAAVAVVPLLAWFGRPEGVKLPAAHVPTAYEALTQDVIVRALGSLGVAGINSWLKDNDPSGLFPGPVRQDGPGWRAEVDLPWGVTATQIIERRPQLASGLRRPLGAVWPEPQAGEHAGRLELYVGREDISKARTPPWPLLRSGTVDVFGTFPYATDVRGRVVKVPLIYHNWLMGSIPRQGKTAAVRVLACAAALDPLAELWIHENKGTGDLDELAQVSHRFVSGIDDEAIGYAAESLQLLRREVEQRAPRIKALDPKLCPERKVTREIASRKSLKLRPIIAFFDEVQNVFSHPKHGKQAGETAEWLIKVAPATGIVLVLATQRPDAASLPTGVTANVSYRFCLKVMGHTENDMILGTSAHKNGIRATTFRQGVDLGMGYLIGEDPAQVCRTYYLDTGAAKVAVARARAARERAGTLTGYAAGEDASGPARDVLGDALAVFGDDPALHWATLAGRLASRWPDRWADVTGDAISAQLRALGVRSVQVNRGGQNLQGCRRAALHALQP
jgi:S-DNA-T family DNA segregation ATPase FtsK/SpoIIIE